MSEHFTDFRGAMTPQAITAATQVVGVVAMHTTLNKILQSCLATIEAIRHVKLPSGILIQAEPGMGKTLLLKLLALRLVPAALDQERPCTTVKVELEAGADVYTLASSTMLSLGYPVMPSTPKLANMNQMVDRAFERLRPLGLLVDELQHVCEGNKDIKARTATDWIKVRMDRHNFTFVGVGTPTAERLSEINPQFASRVATTFVIPAFEFGESWRQVLAAFIPEVKVVDMSEVPGELSRKIHFATKGNLRALKRLLMFSAMHAANKAGKRLEREDLAKGMVDAFGERATTGNPFL